MVKMEAMNQAPREIDIEVAREGDDSRSVDVYLFDGARRIGRYQVRANADGRRDVYYSEIEGKSFSKTRKVQKAPGGPVGADPISAAIEKDLAGRGMAAPALASMKFAF